MTSSSTNRNSPQNSDAANPLKNARHEAFAQNIADGNSEKDSYKEVYNCKTSTARIESSKLYRNPLVRARVDFLKAQNAHANGLSRARKREILAAIAEDSHQDPRARISAIQEDNRMTGDAEDKFKLSASFSLHWPS